MNTERVIAEVVLGKATKGCEHDPHAFAVGYLAGTLATILDAKNRSELNFALESARRLVLPQGVKS